MTGKRDSSFTVAARKWPKELLNGAGLSESSMLQMRLLICIVAHKLPKRLPGDITAFESVTHVPISSPNKLNGSPSWTWMEFFPWSVSAPPPRMNRPFFPSPKKKVTQHRPTWASKKVEASIRGRD